MKKKSTERPALEHVISEFEDCADFVHHTYLDHQINLVYCSSLINKNSLYRNVVEPLEHIQIMDLPRLLKQPNFSLTTDSKLLVIEIASGQAALFFQENAYLINIAEYKSRSVSASETESVITGPHDAFTEHAETNL